MLHLYCCDISKLTDEEFLKMYRDTDRQRRNKAERLNRTSSKKLTVAAGMLARIGIAQKLNINPCDISFRNHKGGKPYADGLDIHFSLSHSGNLAVCAISDKPVGIDAERYREINLNVAKRCFTQSEQRYVASEQEKSTQRFFEIWTKKEAYVKLLGTGVQDFLTFDALNNDKLYTIQYKDYAVSVATE